MKENGKIYAMKVLDKSKVLEYGSFCVFEIGWNNMNIHLPKDVLCKIFHIPSLFGMDLYSSVMNSLRYAFQSQTKLCLVMDFFNGGELFHYLSMGRFSEVL